MVGELARESARASVAVVELGSAWAAVLVRVSAVA